MTADGWEHHLRDLRRYNAQRLAYLTILRHPEIEQTSDMVDLAMEFSPRILKYVHHYDRNLLLPSDFDPYSTNILSLVKNQTESICIAAVNSYGMALEYVINQTPRICKHAVEQDGLALQFVKNQTYDLCYSAMVENPNSIGMVDKQTEELCLLAIGSKPDAMRDVTNQTALLCEKVISTFQYGILLIREPTEDMVSLHRMMWEV